MSTPTIYTTLTRAGSIHRARVHRPARIVIIKSGGYEGLVAPMGFDTAASGRPIVSFKSEAEALRWLIGDAPNQRGAS